LLKRLASHLSFSPFDLTRLCLSDEHRSGDMAKNLGDQFSSDCERACRTSSSRQALVRERIVCFASDSSLDVLTVLMVRIVVAR
jgi:hypothetical protein